MKRNIKSMVHIILGISLIAFAISTLILDKNIIVGGVTGFSKIIAYYTKSNITTLIYTVNITLLLIALIYLGKSIFLSTILSTFLFPALLDIFNKLDKIHHYCNSILLASILAGCLIGLGIGLVLKGNSSTGGIDIIAILLNRKYNVPIFITLNFIDFFILIFQIPFANIYQIFYGIMIIFIISFVLKKTLVLYENKSY